MFPLWRTSRATRRHQCLPRNAGHLLPRLPGRRVRCADRHVGSVRRTSARAGLRTCSICRERSCRRVRGGDDRAARSRHPSRQPAAAAPSSAAPTSRSAKRSCSWKTGDIGSLPLVDADARPIGIFTRQDVISRVVLPQRPLSTALREVMSAPVVTLPEDATAGDAALLMAQQRHTPRGGRGRRWQGRRRRFRARSLQPAAIVGARTVLRDPSRRRQSGARAMRGRYPRAVAFAGRAGRGRRPADTDDRESQRPAHGAHPRPHGARHSISRTLRCAGSDWDPKGAASRRSRPIRTTD